MKRILLSILITVCGLWTSLAQPTNAIVAEGLQQDFFRTLVSIETTEQDTNGIAIGSGFLVGVPVPNRGGMVVVVTAKHVVFGNDGKLHPNLAVRLNSHSGHSDLMTEETFAQMPGWIISKNSDAACRIIPIHTNSDFATMPTTAFLTNNILQAGVPVSIIGFPMGLRSREHTVPILRHGIVALNEPEHFLLDAFVFPGNSGGPVFYMSEHLNFFTPPPGKVWLQGPWLVGMVVSSLNYTDIAISPQTGRPRVVFEENSGLSSLVPAKAIAEMFESAEFARARAVVELLQ